MFQPVTLSNTSPSDQKNRVVFFDLAKGFCILLVVVFHIAEYYQIDMPVDNMIRSMRMPLYFFLSGCFFKTYNGFLDFLARKTNKLLIPFVFWFLLASLLFPIIFTPRFGSVLLNNFKSMVIGFAYGKFPNGAIWFLLCLFWVNIIFYVISIIARKFKNTLAAIIILSVLTSLIGVSLGAFSIRIPLFIDSAFTSLPFFLFGYLMCRYTPIVTPTKYYKWTPVIVLVLLVLLYFFSPDYTLKNNRQVNYHSFLVIYLCGFAGALSVVLLSKWIKRVSVFNYWGRYSIMILVSHIMVYQLVGYALKYSGLSVTWCFVINLLVTMGICSLLIPFFIKFMPHVTAQKDIIPVGKQKKLPNKERKEKLPN